MLLGVMIALSALTAVALTWQACAVQGLGMLWVLPVSLLGAFLTQVIALFIVIWICAQVTKKKPMPEKENKFFRFLVEQVCFMAMPLLSIRLHTKGLKQIPKSGRFLLICNHMHEIDPTVILRCFPKRQISFISKQEVDKLFLAGPFLRQIRCPLINRSNDREALKTILQCIQMIKNDEHSIAVFPEGYIRNDDLMHPFRSGVFKIAQKANVPIVVCTLHGTHKVLKNVTRLKHTDVHFHLIKVLYPEDWAGKTATDISNMAYELMAQDLGPENVWQKPENWEEKE